jgi:hypothetical protein
MANASWVIVIFGEVAWSEPPRFRQVSRKDAPLAGKPSPAKCERGLSVFTFLRGRKD